jgi:hypothetical protein
MDGGPAFQGRRPDVDGALQLCLAASRLAFCKRCTAVRPLAWPSLRPKVNSCQRRCRSDAASARCVAKRARGSMPARQSHLWHGHMPFATTGMSLPRGKGFSYLSRTQASRDAQCANREVNQGTQAPISSVRINHAIFDVRACNCLSTPCTERRLVHHSHLLGHIASGVRRCCVE